MSTDKLTRLQKLFIEKALVSTKELKDNGFSDYDIKKLCEDKQINRIKRGIYKVDTKLLYITYDNVLNAFKACIKNEDYQTSLKYLKRLLNFRIDLEKFQNHHLYLLLLKNLVTLPEDLYALAISLDLEDLLNNVKYSNVKIYNDLKRAIYDRHLQTSNQIINIILSTEKSENLEIIGLLIRASLKTFNDFKHSMTSALESQEYEKVIKIIELEATRRELILSEKNLLHLCKAIVYIKQTGQLPKKEPLGANPSLNDCINANHFKEAREHMLEMVAVSINQRYALKLLDEISSISLEQEKQNHKKDVFSRKRNNLQVTLDDIYEALLTKDVKYIYNYVTDYLDGKSPFEIMAAKNLVLISLLFNCNQVEVLYDLKMIKDGKLSYNAAKYLKFFKSSLLNNEYAEMILYFNIVKSCFDLNLLNIDIQKIEKVVRAKKQQNGHISDYNFYQMILDAIDKSRITGISAEQIVQNVQVNQISFDIKAEIQKVIDEKSIFVSDPMKGEDVYPLYSFLEYINDIDFYTIKEGKNYRIVIRYFKYQKDFDYKYFLSLANKAYNREEFQISIKNCLEIINATSNPKWYIYELLAKSYARLKIYDKALDYYRIVQNNHIVNGYGLDCQKIIDSLEYKLFKKGKESKLVSASKAQEEKEYSHFAQMLRNEEMSLEELKDSFRLNDFETEIVKTKSSGLKSGYIIKPKIQN